MRQGGIALFVKYFWSMLHWYSKTCCGRKDRYTNIIGVGRNTFFIFWNLTLTLIYMSKKIWFRFPMYMLQYFNFGTCVSGWTKWNSSVITNEIKLKITIMWWVPGSPCNLIQLIFSSAFPYLFRPISTCKLITPYRHQSNTLILE